MKKIYIMKLFIIIIFCFKISGCKYEYDNVTYKLPRPQFEQVFSLFSVDDVTKDKIKNIYDKMTTEELIYLKYNYYSAIPVFYYSNNYWNPQDTIYYQGNSIIIRGSVASNDFENLFKTALKAYKNDDTNKLK